MGFDDINLTPNLMHQGKSIRSVIIYSPLCNHLISATTLYKGLLYYISHFNM